ncbi:MAG: aldo/keto reductase [Bacillales bacterium]|jgi:predicted aldo/keto reductase-like oxidoreductase|nr:aldo/keto reductase [Bacillales bacterium]
MEKRKFKKLSVEPSLLGFGCMRLPTLSNGKIDRKETRRLLNYAYENGVTYFDTAYPYHSGESELVVGEILKDFPRNSFYLATKLPGWLVKKEEDILKIFKEQLSKLQVDYLDFYLLHALDKERYEYLKGLGVFEKLMREKELLRIRHLGFSFHGTLEDFIYVLNDGLKYWDFCQIQLNYMDIHHQQGLTGYDMLADLDIPVVIMEPVKGGSLATLPTEIAKPLLDYRPSNSLASWAFRWVASLPQIAVVLSGMSSFEQVKDNINTFNNFEYLNEIESELIEETRIRLESRVFVPCTNCQYCVPCPFKVKINEIFAKFNNAYMYNVVERLKLIDFNHDLFLDLCQNCRVCEKKCPQNIKIPNVLREIQLALKK